MSNGLNPQLPSGNEEKMRFDHQVQQVRANQNLSMGVLGGLVGALLGAIGWAIVAVVTEMNIGFVAIGVGFLAAYGVRLLGKGIDPVFGMIGAITALVGVILGDLLTACIVIARDNSLSFWDVLGNLDLEAIIELEKAMFSPMTIVFYAIAVWAGYKYALVKPEPLATGPSPSTIPLERR